MTHDSDEKNNLQIEQPEPLSNSEKLSNGAFSYIRPILLLIGIVLVVFSFMIRNSEKLAIGVSSWVLMIGGMVIFLLTWIPSEKVPFIKSVEQFLITLVHKMHLSAIQLILLISTPFLLVITHVAAGNEGMMASPWLAVFAWLFYILFGSLSGWKREKIIWNKKNIIFTAAWTLGFIALGIWLRVFGLTYIPVNLTGDEASAGLFSIEFLDGIWNNIFRTGWYEFPSMYFLIPASSISIIGRTTIGLRFPSVIAGGITVGLLYLLGRTLYDHRTGVVAAALLAASHFHIHFSRIGLNNIWDGVFYVSFFGLLWRAWQKENRNLYIIAGIILGFSQYFYASARMLLILAIVWLFILWMSDRKKFKKQIFSVVFMLWVAILVCGPLLFYMTNRMDEFMAPITRVFHSPNSVSHIDFLLGFLHQLGRGLGAYSFTDTLAWYASGSPILLTVESGFFVVGILLLFLHWREPKSWMLLTWLLAFGIIGGLSESTPAAQRYSASVPAAMLVASFALNQIMARLLIMLPKFSRLVADGITWLIVLSIMVVNLNFYYNQYTPESYNRDYNTLLAQRLATWLSKNPQQWQVLFFGNGNMGYFSIPSIRYLAPNATGYDVNEVWGDENNPKPEPGNVLFVFLNTRDDDRLAVEAQYPECSEIEELSKDFGLLYNAWVCTDFKP